MTPCSRATATEPMPPNLANAGATGMGTGRWREEATVWSWTLAILVFIVGATLALRALIDKFAQ